MKVHYKAFEFESSFEEDTLNCVVYSMIPLKDSLFLKGIDAFYEKNKIYIYLETSFYFPEPPTSDTMDVELVPNEIKFNLYPLQQKKYNVEISLNGVSREIYI